MNKTGEADPLGNSKHTLSTKQTHSVIPATMEASGKQQTHSGQTCNTCGGVGGVDFQELIATCTRCSIAREHVYCMQNLLYVVPEDWVCESCLSSDLVLSEASRKEDVVGTLLDSSNIVCQDNTPTAGPSSLNWAYSKRKKPFETGKVKFLPTEEVIKLSSSAPKKVTSVRSNSGSKPCPPSMASSRNTHVGSTAATPKFCSLSVVAAHCLRPSGLVKPPRNGGVHSSTNQKALQELKNVNALEVLSGRETMDPRIAKEHETYTKKTEDVTNKASFSSSKTVIPDGNFRGAAACNNSDVEERDLLNILPIFELYHDYLPALHATWWGGFAFTAAPFKFYGGFQAQPPCTINHKAFEFSKRMPSSLQVMFVPRCQVWEYLFHNSCPHLSDVALYIFPADNIESSKENMSCLYEQMEVHNSMMRSCFDGVELLIFTSSQLHLSSQRFLWAIFLPKEVCMDIDMIGGQNVGRVDVAISRHASSRQY